MASNALLEYINFLHEHESTHCCKKLGQFYFDDLEPIAKGKSDKYYLDTKAAEVVVKFIQGDIPDLKTFNHWMKQVPPQYRTNAQKVRYIERYMGKNLGFIRQSKGEWEDLPLVLEPFQMAILYGVYGIKRKSNHKRRFNETWIEMARKNGKTTLQCPIALYALFEEPGAEVYATASTYQQSRRLWEQSRDMIVKSPMLSQVLKSKVNPRCDIYYKKRNSHYYALSKNVKAQDGFNASCVIIDEAHALANDRYNILKQATAITQQPLTNIITTAGTVRGGLFDNKYDYYTKVLNRTIEDDRIFIAIYELDDKEEMWDEEKWYKANPGLGVIKSKEYLRGEVLKSKEDMVTLSETLVKDFNVVGVSNNAWLSAETINRGAYGMYDPAVIDNPSKQAEWLGQWNNSICIGGFDLSRTGDLTAWTTLVMDKEKHGVIAKTMYWCTETFLESMTAKQSQVPWKAWIDRGLIRVSTSKNQINYNDIVQYVLEEFRDHGYIFQKINYDPYSANSLVEELAKCGYSKKSCLTVTGQNFKTLSVPMQTMEAFLKDRKLCYLNNPVTKWMFTNIELKQDINGNQIPRKLGEKYENKIDGPATILDTFVTLCTNINGYIGHEGEQPKKK